MMWQIIAGLGVWWWWTSQPTGKPISVTGQKPVDRQNAMLQSLASTKTQEVKIPGVSQTNAQNATGQSNQASQQVDQSITSNNPANTQLYDVSKVQMDVSVDRWAVKPNQMVEFVVPSNVPETYGV